MNIITAVIGICATALLIYYFVILMEKRCDGNDHTICILSGGACFAGDSVRTLYQQGNEWREGFPDKKFWHRVKKGFIKCYILTRKKICHGKSIWQAL